MDDYDKLMPSSSSLQLARGSKAKMDYAHELKALQIPTE